MSLNTCVSPDGRFVYGIHKPSFRVSNQRANSYHSTLGFLENGEEISNEQNFPDSAVQEDNGTWIFEIPNPLPFRGATFIKKDWADERARNPESIRLPKPSSVSLNEAMPELIGSSDSASIEQAFRKLPPPLLLALATTSTDPSDLVCLAKIACHLVFEDDPDHPVGLEYQTAPGGRSRPRIDDSPLFEALVNNSCLPDNYKKAMVLKPGVQGGSEIVGEFKRSDQSTHVFEYLRRNSYIAWGHFAANMADDAVRYSAADLSSSDMTGLRHLYYQRTFIRLAEELGIDIASAGKSIPSAELETMRQNIVSRLSSGKVTDLKFTSTLWGWNYGFDFAPTQYRLHASHQQIHQQFALLPGEIPTNRSSTINSYSCGDMVADFCERFRAETGNCFFSCYLEAIRNNKRIDADEHGPASLIIYEDQQIILFVPKAQTSQWELQLICLEPVGNILEADQATRDAVDKAMLLAMRLLSVLGAKMITTIEFSKRFNIAAPDQRLFYSFLPKLPESPGAFSEAQLRWINGHYPEDFAEACRQASARI